MTPISCFVKLEGLLLVLQPNEKLWVWRWLDQGISWRLLPRKDRGYLKSQAVAKELVDSELQQWHRRNTADQHWPLNLCKWKHFQRCKMHRIFKSWVIPIHPINTCDSTAKIRIQISRSSAIYGLGWKAKWPQRKNRKGPTKTLNLKIPDYWIIEFEGTRQRRSRRMIRKTLKLRQQTGGHELSSGASRINPHSVPVWVTKTLGFDPITGSPPRWKSRYMRDIIFSIGQTWTS